VGDQRQEARLAAFLVVSLLVRGLHLVAFVVLGLGPIRLWIFPGDGLGTRFGGFVGFGRFAHHLAAFSRRGVKQKIV
jgi:hypothetical protein